MVKQKVLDVKFSAWLGLVCKHDPLAYPRLLCMILLMFGASFLATMHSAIVGYPLFFALGGAFMWALHRAWRLALKNPPWYLKSEGSVAFSPKSGGNEAARTDND